MTAPLPDAVEKALNDALNAASDFENGHATAAQVVAAEDALRAAIAASLAPGEPVAWEIIDKDGVLMLDHPFRSREAAESVMRECETWWWPARAPFALRSLHPAPPAPPVAESNRDAVERAVAAEREACAKVCEEEMGGDDEFIAGCDACAAAIRARGGV